MMNDGLWKTIARIWLVVVICILLLLVLKIYNGGFPLQTNMLKLLPKTQRDILTEESVLQYSNAFIKNVVFLIGAKSHNESYHLASEIAENLQHSGLFRKVDFQLDVQTGIDVYGFYQKYSRQLLSNVDRELLRANNFSQLNDRLLASMASPGSGYNADMLQQDPAMLFSSYMSSLKPYGGALVVKDNVLSVERNGQVYTLISATLNNDPFSISVQQDFINLYSNLKERVKRENPHYVLLSAGMIHNVAAGTNQAKREISIIGGGSIVGLLLLFLISFFSLRPLFYALIPITVGITSALLFTLMVFNEIHVITLVFGASLIGVSIDYALHFFAEQSSALHVQTPRQSITCIIPAISLGLITSLIGYISFFIAPFPGLRQMALFSSVGLLSAYCCVVFWFPWVPSPTPKRNSTYSLMLAQKFLSLWSWRYRMCLPLLLVVVAGLGITRVHSNDDIRLLDNTPKDLKKEQADVENITSLRPASQFFLIRGESVEQMLQREEGLAKVLYEQLDLGNLAGFRAISGGLPSKKMQQENFDLLYTALNDDGGLTDILLNIGFKPEVIETYRQRIQIEPQWLGFEQWRQSSIFIENQWLGKVDGQWGSLVHIYGVNNIHTLKEKTGLLEGVQLVDQVSDITSIFGEYRRLANYLICLAYVGIFILLLFRYRIIGALKTLMPPLLAAAIALAVAGYTSQPISLFNTLALLLVLGIGIDYTLFFSESKSRNLSVMLGVMLSAFTTILSFGLLALSSTPAIQSIGITVLCGIAAAFVLAPMAAKRMDISLVA